MQTKPTHGNLDLSFAPVVNAAPARLSADQIAAYNRDGFVRPFDVFSPTEMSDIRAYIDRLMDDM
ncbi:MAG: phytanoyl-CoA dioxygenase, partial [Paracoccaceae bacterium]